jgi:hypothetical protein
MSVNTYHCGNCSTKYNTLPRTWVVYRRFRIPTSSKFTLGRPLGAGRPLARSEVLPPSRCAPLGKLGPSSALPTSWGKGWTWNTDHFAWSLTILEIPGSHRASPRRDTALEALMMEAVRTSETSIHSNETTRRYIPQDSKPFLSVFRILFWDVLPCKRLSTDVSEVMMEAVRTSETSVDNHFTRQYIPEDNSEHNTPQCSPIITFHSYAVQWTACTAICGPRRNRPVSEKNGRWPKSNCWISLIQGKVESKIFSLYWKWC